jgi:hypothetical protein
LDVAVRLRCKHVQNNQNRVLHSFYTNWGTMRLVSFRTPRETAFSLAPGMDAKTRK